MKIPTTLILVSVGAASAFGLQPSQSFTNSIKSNNVAYGASGKALVRPIGLDGQRLGCDAFVSLKTFIVN